MANFLRVVALKAALIASEGGHLIFVIELMAVSCFVFIILLIQVDSLFSACIFC
jgi:hypothetical protein